ncbi:MAG: sigma-70 family RNA polymerase sigma factor [Pirellulaceae bacterium]|nr:sigma-70 family RNA polymerase sigma factor [Pirellulaceae bacterium]
MLRPPWPNQPAGCCVCDGTICLSRASQLTDAALSDDTQLIEATLRGDSSAFGQLVRKHQDRLYNTLVHVTGHREDARDLTQEAFVQAFVKLDTFRRSSTFYTWLYRIALNRAASYYRGKKPTTSLDRARADRGDEPVESKPGPGNRLEVEESRNQVRAALARLSEEHRNILVLREIEGCDYETIAAVLDVPVGTVRSRLYRARMQMHHQLKEVFTTD